MGCRGSTELVVVDVGYDGCAFPYVAGKGMFGVRRPELQLLKLTCMELTGLLVSVVQWIVVYMVGIRIFPQVRAIIGVPSL